MRSNLRPLKALQRAGTIPACSINSGKRENISRFSGNADNLMFSALPRRYALVLENGHWRTPCRAIAGHAHKTPRDCEILGAYFDY
jgi:hypothetical protein